jgi:hypothetical protein
VKCEATDTSEICPPNLRPLHSGFDIISYLCFAWEAGQCRRKSSFDMVVRISHICKGDAAELQVFGFVLAARIVKWKLRFRLATSSSARSDRRIYCRSSVEGR